MADARGAAPAAVGCDDTVLAGGAGSAGAVLGLALGRDSESTPQAASKETSTVEAIALDCLAESFDRIRI